MHGRIKVRTTDEERERKKKEQALKMRAYRAAMGRIQKKRAAGELDDEMLTLTVQILQRNPDISTLWNIRRECVLAKVEKLQQQQAAEEHQPAVVEEHSTEQQQPTVVEEQSAQQQQQSEQANHSTTTLADKLQAIYNTELSLTELCLMVNPKSYNGWHHRCWTLEQDPQADWQHELQLCNKYLKHDERNFHTWDYRRFVTAKAHVPPQQELDFCTEKIKVNFSNYSSWHHRSLLLPQLYPYEGSVLPKRPMSEAKLKEELEMVLTAAFTDPNDSSAWFYQRWLLGGNGAHKEQPCVGAFRCAAQRAVLAFNKSNPGFAQSQVYLLQGEQRQLLSNWTPVNASNTLWQCSTSLDIDAKAAAGYVLQLAAESLQLALLPDGLFYFRAPQAGAGYTEALLQELQAQLQSCLDLLEYEPNSKWTLLTSALLMRAIDAGSYHAQSLQHLSKLQTVDALRSGYYKDLAARWSLEQALTNWPQAARFPSEFQLDDMPMQSLQTLPYAQYLSIADELKLPANGQSADCTESLPMTFAQLSL